MQNSLAFFFIFLIAGFSSAAQDLKLLNGLTLRKSATIDSMHYRFDAKSKNKPVLTISGKNLVIDFAGSEIQGSNKMDSPDQFFGTGIEIKKAKNITIRNLKIRGFRHAIIAKDIDGLRFENCDFSNQYRQPLEKFARFNQRHVLSNFSIHYFLENAIELRECNNIVFSGCRARGNENVLYFNKCTNALVVNNDFSFNSGAAVVLNASHNNQFLYNRFNFNVADTSLLSSASFVMDGNSSSNIIYKNSITHSANGIIVGGNLFRKNPSEISRNLIMENDLSYNFFSGISSFNTDAVINKNRMYHSNVGSFIVSPREQGISNNQYRYNTTAIRISGNGSGTINHNIFFEDQTALQLSSYSYYQLLKGKGLKAIVVANSFNRNRVVYDLDRVDSIAEFNNLYQQYDTLFRADSSMMNVDVEENEEVLVNLSADIIPALKEVAGAQNPFKGNGRFAGRRFLVPARWGPYDYSYPLAISRKANPAGDYEIDILGPEGEWRIKEIRGAEVVDSSANELPGKLIIKRTGTGKPFMIFEFIGVREMAKLLQDPAKGSPVYFSPAFPD